MTASVKQRSAADAPLVADPTTASRRVLQGPPTVGHPDPSVGDASAPDKTAAPPRCRPTGDTKSAAVRLCVIKAEISIRRAGVACVNHALAPRELAGRILDGGCAADAVSRVTSTVTATAAASDVTVVLL